MTTSRSRRRFIRSGDGMAPYRTAALRAPLMRVPNNEDFAYALLLSRNPPPDVPVAPLDAMNRTIYERARSLGGSRMTWGSIPLTQADWIEHYGPVWDFFREAKERFDANNVLTPGPEIFPGAACAVEKDGSVTRSGARDLSSPDTVATQRRGEDL